MLNTEPNPDFLPGTLEMLILQTLGRGRNHGYGIAQHIRRLSSDALRIEEGSLYPAMQRLQARGFVASEWKTSPTGRQARYYRLTASGRRRLEVEEASFRDSVNAITRVLRGAES